MEAVGENLTVRMADFSGQWEGRAIDGGFPLRRFLNGGGESAVFLTTYENRDAAIKLLSTEPDHADAQLARWRAAQKLVHPNLIRILDMGRSELDGLTIVYVVTEYAEEDLSQVLPDRSLTAVEAREMLEPALAALEYIHAQGFVHAHLKPGNIMAVDNHLKISSDGICRLGAADGSALSPYDPPERAQGIVAPAGDVWALGVTLVEVLTQRRPATSPAVVFPPGLPEPFAEIARHCLAMNPAERWTLAQISKHLNPVRSATVLAPALVARKKRVPMGAVVLLVAAILVVAGVMIRQSQTETPAPTPSPASAASKESVKAPETPPPATDVKPTTVAQPEPAKEAPISTAQQLPDTNVPVEAKPPAEEKTTGETVTLEALGEQPMPEIPAQARRTIRGKVTINVRVEVDPSGAVGNVKLESPSGSRYFADRTLKAVRQWKFKPIAVNGSDSAQRWRIHFEFLTSGTKVQPKRLSP